jgi:hypothetical protein
MIRDPRSTPIPGDIVRSAKDRERWVNSVHGGEISYRAYTYNASRPLRSTRNVCSLAAWRRWCEHEDAVVVTRGEDV